MTAHWGAGEWLTAIGFALGGIWVVSKLLGALWWLVRAPFARLFYHFVDDRVFAGVNPLDDADDDMSSADDGADNPRTTAPAQPAYHRVPDTYQANVSTARRTGTRRSDAEWVVELAAARAPDGKYRFTANAIAALVGGTRKDVLDQVRAIRNLPQWPETSPEQQAQREALGLPLR